MADIRKTVEIIFSIKGAKFYTDLDKASQGIDSFFDRTASITMPLANLADLVLKIEAAIVGLTTAFSVFSVQKAAELESSITSLNKVLEEHEVYYIRKNIEGIEELGLKYGISTIKIINSIAEFKKAGFSLKEAMDLQVDALDLAIAGELEAAEAAKVLATTIIGFNVEAKEARAIIDAVNLVANNFSTTAGQLAISLSKLAPIADLAGLTINETIGLVTPIIEVFRSGSEASNAMKAALQRLVAPSQRSRKHLEELGVAIRDSNGAMRSARDIYFDTASAINKLEKEDALLKIRWLVGIHQAGRVAHAMKNLEKSYRITATAMDSTGSAAKEVNIILNTTKKDMDRVAVSLENLSIAFGDRLLLGVSKVSRGIISVSEALKLIINEDEFKPFFDFINKQTLDLQEFLLGVAEALPAAFKEVDFTNFISQLDSLKKKIVNLNELDFTNPDDLVKAIQFVVDSLESLTLTFSGILTIAGDFFKEILAAIDTFNNLDDGIKLVSGEIAGLAKAINSVLPITYELTIALKTLTVVLAGIAAFTLGKKVKSLVGTLGRLGVFLGVILATSTQLRSVLIGLTPLFKKVGVGLSLITGLEIGKWLVKNNEYFKGLSEEVRNLAESVFDFYNIGFDDKVFDDVQRKMARLKELYSDPVTLSNYEELWKKHLLNLGEHQEKTEKMVKWHQNFLNRMEETQRDFGKQQQEQVKEQMRVQGIMDAKLKDFLNQMEKPLYDWQEELSLADYKKRLKEMTEQALSEETRAKQDTEEDRAAAKEARQAAAEAAKKAAEEATKDKKVGVDVNLKGVEPELEAFVWKIVERAQYGAVYEGQEFLVGLPVKD